MKYLMVLPYETKLIDGSVIAKDTFKSQDGDEVPLRKRWYYPGGGNEIDDSKENRLGTAILKNAPDGLYAKLKMLDANKTIASVDITAWVDCILRKDGKIVVGKVIAVLAPWGLI